MNNLDIEIKTRAAIRDTKFTLLTDEDARQAYELSSEQRRIKDLLIEALENDTGLVSYRRIAPILDRSLRAWSIYTNNKKTISRMLEIKSNSQYRSPSVLADVDVSAFDCDYLEWLDGVIDSLHPESKAVIRYEVFYKDDSRRADKWARDWSMSPRTYYNKLKDLREFLIASLIGRV